MKLFFLVSFIFLSACSTQTFVMRGGEGHKVQDKFSHFIVYGIGQEDEIDLAEICGGSDKVIKVQAKQTFLNSLVGGITQRLYTPRQKKVYCAR